MTDENEVVQHKIRKAAAANALHKIADIVSEENQLDETKDRYSAWILRYGIVSLLSLAVVAAYFRGVF